MVIWSVELSITATASDNLVTTNKEGAKADEAKAQTMNSKGRRALLIIRSLLKPPDVNLDGVTPCFPCAAANSKELCLILIATTSSKRATLSLARSNFRKSLLLRARIAKFNPGSQAARYWGGLSAGAAIVEITEDVDERTNAVLITFRQERRSSLGVLGGEPARAGTDSQAAPAAEIF